MNNRRVSLFLLLLLTLSVLSSISHNTNALISPNTNEVSFQLTYSFVGITETNAAIKLTCTINGNTTNVTSIEIMYHINNGNITSEPMSKNNNEWEVIITISRESNNTIIFLTLIIRTITSTHMFTGSSIYVPLPNEFDSTTNPTFGIIDFVIISSSIAGTSLIVYKRKSIRNKLGSARRKIPDILKRGPKKLVRNGQIIYTFPCPKCKSVLESGWKSCPGCGLEY